MLLSVDPSAWLAGCFVGADCALRRMRTAVWKACDADTGAGVARRLPLIDKLLT
jgi:hypothetical protein